MACVGYAHIQVRGRQERTASSLEKQQKFTEAEAELECNHILTRDAILAYPEEENMYGMAHLVTFIF